MNVSDRQSGRRPAVPAEGRRRSWPDTGRAGCLAAAAALSLLFASGLRAEPAETPWIPLPQAWIDAGKVLPEEPTGEAVWNALLGGRHSVAETEACKQPVGESAAWAAIVGSTDEAAAPEVSGGRIRHDNGTLDAPGGLWLKVTGGTYTSLNGGNYSDWTYGLPGVLNFSHPKHLNGDACLYLTGDTVVNDHVSGGDYKMAGSPKMTGSAAVIIDGNAQVKGSIFGAGPLMHGGNPTLEGDTDIVVRNVQTYSGRIVGAFGWMSNTQSHATLTGNTRILIDIPKAEPAPGTAPEFVKDLFGGPMVGNGADESVVTGNTSVTVNAPGVKFAQCISGAGIRLGDGPVKARVRGNSTVTLQDGIFAGTVRAGGWTDNALVDGTATLEIQGGTYEAAAKLLPGTAAKSVMKQMCRLSDLSGIAQLGRFDRVEVAPNCGLEIADRHVHTGTVYSVPRGGRLHVKLTENPDGTYIFPGRVEGDGMIGVGAGGTSWQPLVRNRVRLVGQDRLWVIPADGSWETGWLTGNSEPAEAPTEGSFIIDASGLTQDTEVTVPAGTFGTVSVFGTGTSFLTLRFESGVTAETLNLYQDARVRYAAADGETIPFAVTGTGVFEAACAGRTELSRPITLTAPGALRISGGTLAFANGNKVSGDVRVCAGAVLDCNGVPDADLATVTLEAGAVYANDSVTEIPVSQKQITALALEGDAFVRAGALFGMVAPGHARSYIRLNGHTLTKIGAADFICANTDCGNGTLDIREGNVRAMGNGGKSAFWDITVRTADGCGIAVPAEGEWAEYNGAVTLAPDAGTQMDVPVRLIGGGLLRIASGTVKVTHKENLRWGAVQVDRGAVLDLTEPEVEVIHTDKPGEGYGWVQGWQDLVTVRGTLRTRPWCYNGAFGGMHHVPSNLLLDGGIVEFAGTESFDESGATRGYTVSSKGATLVVPAGGLYAKAENANARLVNNGTLKLRSSDPAGQPATVVYRQAIGGTVDVGDNVFLCGTGSVNKLEYRESAWFDRTVDRTPMTVTGSVILPAAAKVKANTVPTGTADGIVLLKLAANATVVGGLNRTVTLDGQDGAFTLAKRGAADGAAEIVVVPADKPVTSLIDTSVTSGKASWSAVTEVLKQSGLTPAEQAAAVIDLATLPDGTFTFDNAEALFLSSLTLKGFGTVILNGTVNVGRLWAAGAETGSGTLLIAGNLTVVGTLEIADGTTLGLTRAMLAENVTVNNAGILRWLEPNVSLSAAKYSNGKGTVAFLGTADGNAQTLTVTGETPMPGADMHLGSVNVTGGGDLDLPNATMTVEGNVTFDGTVMRVGQADNAKTAVVQTSGRVDGTGKAFLQFNGWSATSTYSLQGGELNLPVTFYMTGGTAALNISGGRLTSKVTTVNNPASVTVTLSETGVLATALPAQVNLKAQGGTVVGAADRTIAATAVLTGGAQGVLLDASAAPVVFTAATVADPAAALRVKVGTDTNARDLVRGVGTGLNDFTLEGNLPAGLKADWDADTQTLRLVAAAVIPPEYTSEAGDAVLKVSGGIWPTTLTGTTAGGRELTSQDISNALTVFDGIASGDADAVTVHYEFGIRAMVFDRAANQLKLTVALTNGTDPAQLTKGTVLRLYEGDTVKAEHADGLNDRGEAEMTLPMHDGAFQPIKVEAYKETSAPAAP